MNNFTFSENSKKDLFKFRFEYKYHQAFNYWDNVSIFDNYKINLIKNIDNDNIFFKPFNSQSSIKIFSQSLSFTNFSYSRFKQNFFFFLYSGYEASSRKYKIEQSGLGYVNDWVNLSLIKSKENWGAGDNIELGLNESSKPYDYVSLSSNYGKIKVKYIHGFLETTTDSINRFLTGRGLEWTNNKSFLIGFSEVVVYSGLNRSIDIGYLNPLSTHLEVELNNRLKFIGDTNANAIWQLHLDFLVRNKIRISLNYLIDEFVLDPNIEIEKEHGRAHSFQIMYRIIDKKDKSLVLYFQNILIGTPTFRHNIGNNNFVINNLPIGIPLGSDIYDLLLGLSYVESHKNYFGLEFGQSIIGNENINTSPYDPFLDYQKSAFPSGDIKINNYFNLKYEKSFYNYFLVSLESKFSKIKSNKFQISISHYF